MDFSSFAQHMYPFWIIGAIVVAMVIAAGKKDMIRFEKMALLKWGFFLVVLTGWRYLLAKVFNFQGLGDSVKHVTFLPWTVSLTVFWEDACHGLPLLLLKNAVSEKKWGKFIYYPILAMVMFAFGSGHVYQGILPACLLSFYIPYSIEAGKKYGFGTVMLCHMAYDAATLLFAQYLS